MIGGERKQRNWTKDEESMLKELFFAGISYRGIATRLNRTVCSVEHRRARLGLRADRKQEE